MAAIRSVLWTNPWLIAGGSVLEADPLRSERLYSWSAIIYYGFRYPGAGMSTVGARALLATGAYAAAALALHALAWLATLISHRESA
jgi:hypothetical protein